jgi:hypothetical protein
LHAIYDGSPILCQTAQWLATAHLSGPMTDCQWVAFRGMGIVYQDPVVPFAVAT